MIDREHNRGSLQGIWPTHAPKGLDYGANNLVNTFMAVIYGLLVLGGDYGALGSLAVNGVHFRVADLGHAVIGRSPWFVLQNRGEVLLLRGCGGKVGHDEYRWPIMPLLAMFLGTD